MRNNTTRSRELLIGDEWSDPLEQQVRGGVRQFLPIEQEITEALGRLRQGRPDGAKGYREGHRPWIMFGSFGRVQGDFENWRRRIEGEPIVRLMLDGTVVHVRLDEQSTWLSILVAPGVRADGQEVLLGLRALGGESEAAWRDLLQDLEVRGLKLPELVTIDGGKGLEAVLVAMWLNAAVQCCTVRKLRNLIAHARSEHQVLAGLGIFEADAAQRFRVAPLGIKDGQGDRMVADHPGAAVGLAPRQRTDDRTHFAA